MFFSFLFHHHYQVGSSDGEGEKTSLLALAALAGTLRGNPLSRKLFAAGGYVARLSPLLALATHMQTVDLSEVTALPYSSSSHPPSSNGSSSSATGSRRSGDVRRRWGWGGGGGGAGSERNQFGAGSVKGGVSAGGGEGRGRPGAVVSNRASPLTGGSGNGNGVALGDDAGGDGGDGATAAGVNVEGGGSERQMIPVARIKAALALLSALIDASPLQNNACFTAERGEGGGGGEGGGSCGPSSAHSGGLPIDESDRGATTSYHHHHNNNDSSSNRHTVIASTANKNNGRGASSSSTPISENMPAMAIGDDVLGPTGHTPGLFEAIAELALAITPRAAAGGVPTWAEYGLPVECQRAAMEVLVALVDGHAGNQVRAQRGGERVAERIYDKSCSSSTRMYDGAQGVSNNKMAA